jgi:hypothetical protein
MNLPLMTDIDAQIACVEREIRFREHVYPRRVEANKMTEKQAREQIALMQAVLATLRKVNESELLL